MAHDPITEINCTTGVVTVRPPTDEEKARAALDAKEAKVRYKARVDADRERDEKRAAVLASLSEATGFTADELREALNA